MTIRVAHIKSNWLPLSENWLYWLVTRMPDEVEDHVMSEKTCNLDRFSVKHLHVILNNPGLRLLAGVRGLRRAIRCYAYAHIAQRFSPHLIHSHFGFTGWQTLPLARQLRVPHVISFYGIDVSVPEREKTWRNRYHELFDQAAAILCQGPHMIERIIALGARREQMRLFRLGIEIDHLPYRPRTWTGVEPLRVLIAARFVEKKGIPYALEALTRIASRVSLEIHLVGDADDSVGSQAEKLRITDAIERGGLADRIFCHGMMPYESLIELAYRCHVFLSPSVHAVDGDSEGGGLMAANEMAATGMPIVTTTHCDIPYYLGGEENALFAPERDSHALADRLFTLVENRGDWRPMLDRARKHVEQSYNVVKQGEELAQIYREVLGFPI